MEPYKDHFKEYFEELIEDEESPIRGIQQEIERKLPPIKEVSISAKKSPEVLELYSQLDDLVLVSVSTGMNHGVNFILELNRKEDNELAEMIQKDCAIINYIINPSDYLVSLSDFNKL